jgi:hypothetical protein
MSSMAEVEGAHAAAEGEAAGYDDGWIKSKIEHEDNEIHEIEGEIGHLKFKEGKPSSPDTPL